MLELNRQERQVILFVLSLALSGAAIQLCLKNIPGRQQPAYLRNLGKIDLNSAGPQLLETLPGIGRRCSQRIVEYRQLHGNFTDLGGLANIKGLRKSLIPRIGEYVYIE